MEDNTPTVTESNLQTDNSDSHDQVLLAGMLLAVASIRSAALSGFIAEVGRPLHRYDNDLRQIHAYYTEEHVDNFVGAFEQINQGKLDKLAESNPQINYDAIIPDEFICPIAHVIMDDPVTTADGKHTFERTQIQRWLKNNQANPISRESLSFSDLQENTSLKDKIAGFIDQVEARSKVNAQLSAGMWKTPAVLVDSRNQQLNSSPVNSVPK